MREPFYETLFIRYGAGAEYVRLLTKTKIWNILAWILIFVFGALWIVFLAWNPQD